MTVMPGPQLVSAVPLAKAVKARFPDLPIIWGGNFGSLYPEPVLNAPYIEGEGNSRDFDFTREGIRVRWGAGYDDTRRVLGWFSANRNMAFETEEAAIGGIAYETLGTPEPDETIAKARVTWRAFEKGR